MNLGQWAYVHRAALKCWLGKHALTVLVQQYISR